MEKILYTLGYFDGVHLGHRALLDACCREAEKAGCLPGAVAFSGHPQTLTSGKSPRLISTAYERDRLLRQHLPGGVLLPLTFDEAMRGMPWNVFLEMLRERDAAGFVCGSDFRFGYQGQGDVQKLTDWCREKGLSAFAVPQVKLDGIRVSSTHIRALLEAGDMEAAARFLGHPYTLTGTVVTGKQLGRTIGVPTANLLWPGELCALPFGVYAAWAYTEEKACPAVVNIGTRPTVSGEGVTVESHLIDFSGDLYGKTLTLAFQKRLRQEEKFESLQQLKAQIQADMKSAKKVLKMVKSHP